jgi:hypothetical protein
MTDYAIVLTRRYQGKEWTTVGGEYTDIVWHSEGSKPSKSVLDGLWASVQQEIADEAAAKVSAREALLTKLGITAAEAQLLLGA